MNEFPSFDDCPATLRTPYSWREDALEESKRQKTLDHIIEEARYSKGHRDLNYDT